MSDSIALQQSFWNAWNAQHREQRLSDVSIDQRNAVLKWLSAEGRTDLDIIEVGCGAGWLCPWLKPFGRVTATDLSDQVVERARERIPDVHFVAGDFMALDFDDQGFDVVVSLEVLAHIADQAAFVGKLASLLRADGLLLLATQNGPVLSKLNNVPPPRPGQLRHWTDRPELEALLAPHFKIESIRTITPVASRGPMRLLAGRQMKRVWRALTGRALEQALANAGWGWTLMVAARRAHGAGQLSDHDAT